MKRVLFFLLFLLAIYPSQAMTAETSVLSGRVLDAEGNGVEGAYVYIYNNQDIRRPADFMSPRTDKDGRFRLVLPAGRYRPVARLKRSEEYGPLMPGDRHSGEPKEVELSPGAELEMNFTVVDIKEAARINTKTREDYFKINGRIIDESGKSVRSAYAIVNRYAGLSGVPDFISAWTDEEGHYTLYVPCGKYYLGAAAVFPPSKKYIPISEISIESDRSDVNIILKGAGMGESGK